MTTTTTTTTLTVEQIADMVIEWLTIDGHTDYLQRMFDDLLERGRAADADIAAARNLAAKRLRAVAKAKLDHAEALAAWDKARKVVPL